MHIFNKIFSITKKDNHIIYKILGIKFKFTKFYQKQTTNIFYKRNLIPDILIQLNGLYGFKPTKFKDNDLLKWILFYKEILEYLLFHRIYIPQIEFTLTTKCTLKCKNCTNYIPFINKNEQKTLSIHDFKIQLNNLCKSVHKIRNLLLIGGEPLILKNLNEYLEYAAANKKIENVWIVTNGTMLLTLDLINSIKKHSNKVNIWISNYSKNPELNNILKHEDILRQINNANINYYYDKNLMWWPTSPYPVKKLREQDSSYFLSCNNPCVAVICGRIFICPRAGTFYIKNLYEPKQNEFFDLNQKISKNNLINFYSKNCFDACNYCSILEDFRKNRVLPAEQIKNITKEKNEIK
jgi:MoaA/NifB/PqqE/SkfB family radical SAM enzyme